MRAEAHKDETLLVAKPPAGFALGRLGAHGAGRPGNLDVGFKPAKP